MVQEHKANVLLLIHSDNGGTYELAMELAKGVESEDNVEAVIKQVKASDHEKLKDTR